MRKTLAQMSPRAVLAAAILAALLPFLLTEFFAAQLYGVMDIASYLVFHNIAEFFSVMVSLSIFGVGWFAYAQSGNRHTLFLSAAFLAIGLLDFMHTLGYAGMPAFVTVNSANKSTQFWLAARLFSASAFLASAYVYPDNRGPWLAKAPLMVAALAIPALVFSAVTFFPSHVPDTFVAGVGLTPFKKVAEYLIMFLLLLASAAYWRRMSISGDRVLVYYVVAFVICIFSEAVFAIYTSVFDTFNVLGHVYKVVAFILIYQGVFARSVRQPYVELSAANDKLHAEIAVHQQAQKLLRQSESGLEEAQRIAHLGSWKLDVASNQVVWTEELYKMYGFDPALPPPPYTEHMKLFTPMSWERLSSALSNTRETGIPYELELETVLKDGSHGWMWVRGERELAGTAVRLKGVAMDITERKQAEEKVRSASLYARNLLEASLDPLVTISPFGKITDVNEATVQATGVSRVALIGSDFSDYFTEPDKARAGYQEVFEKGQVTDYPLTLRNVSGQLKHVLYNASIYRNDIGEVTGVFAAARDVTERKRAEEELRAASVYARNLLEASQDPLVTINAKGQITDVNEATVQATGLSRAALIGSDFSDYFTEPEKARAGYQEVFAKGQVTDYPLSLRNVSGKVKEVLYNASVYRNEVGEVTGIFAAARDITERKRAEEALHKSHEHLEELVRERTGELENANQELEGFAYSVSHDLRTPLRAIDGFSQQLLKRYADKLDEEGKRYLNVVRDNTKKMSQLIDDILAFSRMGRVGMGAAEIDMGALAHAVFEELKLTASGRELSMELPPLPPCRGDLAMLHQVWINLLGNAIKFTRPSAAALIEVGGHSVGAENIYYVRDNGAGFDMQYADKLFGVFQRLHGIEEFEGTGIGLAIVKRIITRHGGRVWAEGKVGEGATFYFALPI